MIVVAAWADASDAAEPDRYPARERVMFHLSDWRKWVNTGQFHSKRMVLADKMDSVDPIKTERDNLKTKLNEALTFKQIKLHENEDN